jgi:nucleotide-binding universal stress UspA family protein
MAKASKNNGGMQRIMVATDGSDSADRAIDAAARMARICGAELIIVTIGGSVTGAELRQLASKSGDLSKSLVAAAAQVTQRAGKRALKIGAGKIKLQTGWGDPAESIIDLTRSLKPDLLVVGRRGQSRLSGLLLGSVSQKLANHAPCPVMVVP